MIEPLRPLLPTSLSVQLMMSCTMEKGFKLWHTGDHIGAQAQLLLLPLLRMMVVMVALMVVVAMIVYGEKRER